MFSFITWLILTTLILSSPAIIVMALYHALGCGKDNPEAKERVMKRLHQIETEAQRLFVKKEHEKALNLKLAQRALMTAEQIEALYMPEDLRKALGQ